MVLRLELASSDSVQLVHTRRILRTLPLREPKYHQILFLNVLPTEDERKWVFNQLVEGAERLQTLQEELKLLTTFTLSGEPGPRVNISRDGVSYWYPQYLQVEISDTENFLERLQKATSPIRRLDGDTLRLVFLDVFYDSCRTMHGVNPVDGHAVQWRLALVCRAWWNLAFSIPQFWDEVELDVTTEMLCEPTDKTLSRVSRMLDWSHPFPLSLSIRSLSVRFPSDPLPVNESAYPKELKEHPLIRPFITRSHRWKSLAVDTRAYIELMDISELRGQLPSLEIIRITGTMGYVLTAKQLSKAAAHCDVLKFAPSLVSVKAMSSDLRISTLQIPFHQLTHVETFECAILAEIPNLVRAAVSIYAYGPHDAPDAQFVLPRLQDLYFFSSGRRPRIIAPNLTTLRMEMDDLPEYIPVDLPALSRLEALYIDDTNWRPHRNSPRHLVACLCHMPELELLSLTELGDSNEVVCIALTPDPRWPLLCPKLKRLVFESRVMNIYPSMQTCIERRGATSSSSIEGVGTFSPLETVQLWGTVRRGDERRFEALLELKSPKIEH